MTPGDLETLLVAATGLHAGFQLTVSAVVYPALARVGSEALSAAHGAHSRRIAPLVGVVYLAAAAACAGALLGAPSYAVMVTTLATGSAFALTAFQAAPIHGRLGRSSEPDPALLHRLLLVDRLRTAAALVAVGAAVAASL